MASHPHPHPVHSITHSNFRYGPGRGQFRTMDMHDRIASERLKALFLPSLTAEAKELLREHGESFVRGQLQHYGVEFGEGEFSGNGTLLMRRVLKSGKVSECGAVGVGGGWGWDRPRPRSVRRRMRKRKKTRTMTMKLPSERQSEPPDTRSILPR